MKREVSLETMAYREWLLNMLLTGTYGPMIRSLDHKHLVRGERNGHVAVKLVRENGGVRGIYEITDKGRAHIMRVMNHGGS